MAYAGRATEVALWPAWSFEALPRQSLEGSHRWYQVEPESHRTRGLVGGEEQLLPYVNERVRCHLSSFTYCRTPLALHALAHAAYALSSACDQSGVADQVLSDAA
jgi:hypothetical protein